MSRTRLAVLHYVAPVGQKEDYVERARAGIGRYLPQAGKSLVT